jgi:hypothetical protein
LVAVQAEQKYQLGTDCNSREAVTAVQAAADHLIVKEAPVLSIKVIQGAIPCSPEVVAVVALQQMEQARRQLQEEMVAQVYRHQ